jgi:hypothetical protein
MKRQQKTFIPQHFQKKKLRFYPVIFCLKEDKVIAFSEHWLRSKFNQAKGCHELEVVDEQQWREQARWLTPEHKIDFSQFVKGSLVLCPVCKGRVDFRAFGSSTVPTFKSRL